MTILYEERPSDSPYIESVIRGWTVSDGAPVRPAESHWHMVIRRLNGRSDLLVVGPLTVAGITTYGAGAELLWIKFRLGAFMPHLPARSFLDMETPLPGAGNRSFWLKGCAWQFPGYENVETFVDRLAHDEVLARDPLVDAALSDCPLEVSDRTVRERFLRATGLSRNHIRQYERARQAADLLARGTPILDVVFQLGYYDQPHLNRTLKRFIGKTPGEQLSG